jgi:hypothetical protein
MARWKLASRSVLVSVRQFVRDDRSVNWLALIVCNPLS